MKSKCWFFLQHWKRNSLMMRSTRTTSISPQRGNRSTSPISILSWHMGHLNHLNRHFLLLSLTLLDKVPYTLCHSATDFCIACWPKCKCKCYSMIKKEDNAPWKKFLSLNITYILGNILFFIVSIIRCSIIYISTWSLYKFTAI